MWLDMKMIDSGCQADIGGKSGKSGWILSGKSGWKSGKSGKNGEKSGKNTAKNRQMCINQPVKRRGMKTDKQNFL